MGKADRSPRRAIAALKTLTALEERMLRLRFGLDDDEEHTLKEIAQILGVTPSRARQLEARALEKLRSGPTKTIRRDRELEVEL